ncbi:MAG TPA: biopolymer transporter ExbD [Ignavibacteriales bacterium]|nr:biopolymer transporter ExbD [Ignavibacteriales bacterium]HOL80658.1 biopolymer transporter ExbD [Ignavibacteriales bacterium]HOM64346.1 biopolymer transporter ExbD [Ignavibacteriales bacterium]HPD67134.1 biopolymer transporter ExbD [Ignavibacteriales bacterium]HPP33009.1 biopolymer transporter ExbD [Ignavibacteriales bacterium]
MADIDTSQQGGHKKGGKKRGKKLSTRIDMAPMVDVIFLLLTFFMLTTTFSKPQAMQLNMPVKADETTEKKEQDVKASNALTVILGPENKIYYYEGLATKPEDIKTTDYSAEGIRKILLKKKREIGEDLAARDRLIEEAKKAGKDPSTIKKIWKLVVLIKPMDDSNYKNMVDILDEMNICAVSRYAIVDVTPQELDLIKKL